MFILVKGQRQLSCSWNDASLCKGSALCAQQLNDETSGNGTAGLGETVPNATRMMA